MDDATTNEDDSLPRICRDINSRDSEICSNALMWIFDHMSQLTGRKAKLPEFQKLQVLQRIKDLLSTLNK